MSLAFRLLAEASPSTFSISSKITLPMIKLKERILQTTKLIFESSVKYYRFYPESQIHEATLEIYL